MVANNTSNISTPEQSELDALKVIQAVAKLATTHDTYVGQYPELGVLVDAILGEVTVQEPEADDPLLLRLINIIHCLNTYAANSEIFKIIRSNFQADISQSFDSDVPKFDRELYL